jgi:hypothetical protein
MVEAGIDRGRGRELDRTHARGGAMLSESGREQGREQGPRREQGWECGWETRVECREGGQGRQRRAWYELGSWGYEKG